MDDNLTVTPQEFLEFDYEDAHALMTARYHALEALGCDFEAAVIVALHPEVGVAEAYALIRRGCHPRTAIRILL